MMRNQFNGLRRMLDHKTKRKQMGAYSYKAKLKKGTHKKPGLIPLSLKQKLLKVHFVFIFISSRY